MSALPSALRVTCCPCWLLLLLTCLAFLIATCNCASQASQVHHRTRELLAGDDDARRGSSYLDDEADVYDDANPLTDDVDDDYLGENITAEKGQYLGSPCDVSCNPELQHVFCDTVAGLCDCEKYYPVRLGPTKGCAKPKRLGEQCFYRATCTFADQHATCTQVQHNAVCDCEDGYHKVALSRPSKKVFCAEDLVIISTDIPTLLYIASGIAIFTAMICFVLKLFSRARYSRPRHYASTNHAAPMLFSSDTGIPLTLHGGRPSSRSSQRSNSAGPLTCAFTRRPSSAGSRGPLVPASRAGSRRPSLTSVHSSTSSARSYSARRLEKERNEKEQRQALQELRLAKQRDQQQQQQQQQVAPTPSPRTPHSTDELLPSVEEGKEVFYNEVPTTSNTSETAPVIATALNSGVIGSTRSGSVEIPPITTPTTTSLISASIAPRATGDIFQV